MSIHNYLLRLLGISLIYNEETFIIDNEVTLVSNTEMNTTDLDWKC